MNYRITFYAHDREVSFMKSDHLPEKGDLVTINGYIGANEHRNGKYVVEQRNYILDPTYEGVQVVDITLGVVKEAT